jgi:two-component system, chemotaxis family, response regulator Rcp1
MVRVVKILLVEDSPSDAELAREALLQAKLTNELTIVEDGDAAIEYLKNVAGKRENVPDLILLDLNLPKRDGKQVLADIKSNPLLRHIPVVILTTSKAEIDVIKAYQLQASSYITKPVDFDKFVSIVRDIQHFYFQIVTLPPNGVHNGMANK